MKNNKNIIASLALLIILGLTSILFFGTSKVEKTAIEIISYIFIMISELIVFINILLFINKKVDTFTVAGLSSSTFLYLIFTLIFNILLIGIFNTVRGILIFNFSILLIYIFINTIIVFFKKEN